MTPISIPYHLFWPTLISFVFLLIIVIKRKKTINNSKRKSFWISLTAFLAIYMLIVGNAMFEDIYCQWDLNKYDLNMDGFFAGSEITKEQEAAMQRLISDTGRNFSVFTGFIFSGIIAFAVYAISWGIIKYKKLKREEITTHNSGCYVMHKP